MSRLEELIQQLCPDGVEWKKIKDHFTRLRGTAITAGKMKEIADEQGDIRIFAGGKTVINACEKDIPNANITRVPSVLVQSRGIIDVVYYEQPFTFKNEMWAYTSDYNVSVKFLFYYLKNNIEDLRQAAIGMGAMPQISLSATEEMIIPLPPLPVQEEIVRILDTFTESTHNLKEQIQTRRKQYVEYRSNLLDIGMERQPLKNLIVKGYTGATPLKSKAEYYENGTIPWLRTQEVCFNDIYSTDCFITEEALNKTSVKWIPANCVIVAISGATAGRCAINKIPLTTNQHCLSLDIDKTKAIYKFVYYCMCRQNDELIGKKEGARGDLNVSKVLGLKIPCPILPEQQRIVDILDLFEASIANLELQLKQRQKQYEYYRNRLLDFKKKEE